MTRQLLLVAAVCLAVALPSARAGDTAPNVLLITVDTLRADRLGCYGYQRIRTPYIDRLAQEGVRFENAVTPVPITLPAHAALFTGKYPMRTGMHDFGTNRLGPEHPTLATLLQERGYATGAVLGATVLDSRFGLNRGFDVYYDNFESREVQGISSFDINERPGDEVIDHALQWLAGVRGKPFFLWVHLYDPHHPYSPPAPFKSQYRGRSYDGEVAFSDFQVGRLLHALRESNRYDNTLVIFTSDHGESLGEHGESTHGFFLYRSTLHIPLIIKLPAGMAVPRREVEVAVSLVDIAPTVMHLLGLPVSGQFEGESLFPLMLGGRERRRPELYAESFLPRIHFNWSELRSLRVGDYHFIDAPKPELYDLAVDPEESRNLRDQQPEQAERMRAQLQSFIADHSPPPGEGKKRTVGLDAALEERLRSLGYTAVSGGGSDDLSGRDLPDPKDRIEMYELVAAAIEDSQRGRPQAAIAKLEASLAIEKDSVPVQYLLGLSYYQQQAFAKAIEKFERVLQLAPGYTLAAYYLSLAYGQVGQLDDAIAALQYAVAEVEKLQGEESPQLASFLSDLANLELAQGKPDAAEALYRRVLAIDEKIFGSDHVRLAGDANNLGGLLQARGRFSEAESLFRRALAIYEKRLGPGDPTVATSLNNLAGLYRQQGKNAQAEPLFRRALAIREKALGLDDPTVATSLNNLGALYFAQGDYARAEPLLRRALAINEKALGKMHPAIAMASDNLAVVYSAQGKYAEAEVLHRQALSIYERTLGPNHPDVATVLENYAEVLRKLNRPQEAEAMESRAHAIRSRPAPPSPPS